MSNYATTPSSFAPKSPSSGAAQGAVYVAGGRGTPRGRDQLDQITTEQEVIAIIKKKERQRWNYGLFVIFISIVTWMIGNQIINSVIKNGSYNGQPIFISYMTGSGFSIYFVPEIWRFIKANVFFRSSDPGFGSGAGSGAVSLGHGSTDGASDAGHDLDPEDALTFREMVKLSIQISFIYFLNNSLLAFALDFTSSSQQVLLSTSTSFFTLLLGGVFRIEPITLKKLGILALAASGVLLITLNDAKREDDGGAKLKNPVLGDTLALCGSFCYACYLILVKVQIGETVAKVNERLLFGLVGVSTILLIWPFIWVGSYIPGMENFAQPPNLTVWVIVIANGVLTAISDYCSVVAMLLTSPLVAALSLTAAIPIGLSCDSIFYGITNSGLAYYSGMLAILVALVAINVIDETIEHAIGDALEDAILKDENLSPLLSPLMSPQFNRGVGARHEFSFGRDHFQHSGERTHEIYVSGGNNHKYVIRGLDSL